MRGRTGGGVVEALGINSETERRTDARAKGLGVTEDEDTSITDLRLHKGSRVKVRLGANLEVHTASRSLGIIDSLSTCLDVARHAMVIARREDREVV